MRTGSGWYSHLDSGSPECHSSPCHPEQWLPFCMFQLPHSPVGRVLWGLRDSSCRAYLSWCLVCGRTHCMLVIPVIHTVNVFFLPSLHYIEHNWLRVFTTLLRNVLKLQIKSYSCQSAIWKHFQKCSA